jgi:PAS domain-containing protein
MSNDSYLWTTWRHRLQLPLLIICLSLFGTDVHAQVVSLTSYTKSNPLVYEDALDLWPYSFLNTEGKPDGYNIELVGMLLKELNIPYIVKLKPQQAVLDDLKARKADLTLGLAAGFHDSYGLYGHNPITLFTQSVATPKSKSVEIQTFHDLGKHGVKVIVSDSSLCHHLMIDYGWAEHALPSRNMKEMLQLVNDKQEGQIVWNTLALKWLIRHYYLNNLELTPVNMPHGEYKFMSNDQHLLDMLDETYSQIYSADRLAPLENKWFYPDHNETTIPGWLWALGVGALLLLVVGIVYFCIYRIQNRRVMKANNKLNRRLALIIETSKVRIWTYHVEKKEFAWRKDNGEIAHVYSLDEFSHRYSQEDFQQLQDAIDRLASRHIDSKGHEEEEITLRLQAADVEGGDHELHDFVVVLSVLTRDKLGKPQVLICTKKDVTEQNRLKRFEDERTLRYWSIFYSPDATIIYFDKDGYVHDVNPTACQLFNIDSDALIKQHVHLNDFFHTKFTDLRHVDRYHAIQVVQGIKVEYQMKAIVNDNNELLGFYAFINDLSSTEQSVAL